MGMILGLLISRLAGPIAVLLAVLLGVQTFKLASANGHLRKAEVHITMLTKDLQTCRLNTATLETAISRQNEAVTLWKEESAQRGVLMVKARQATQKEAARADRAATALANFKPKGADLCARMLDIDAKVKELTP